MPQAPDGTSIDQGQVMVDLVLAMRGARAQRSPLTEYDHYISLATVMVKTDTPHGFEGLFVYEGTKWRDSNRWVKISELAEFLKLDPKKTICLYTEKLYGVFGHGIDIPVIPVTRSGSNIVALEMNQAIEGRVGERNHIPGMPSLPSFDDHFLPLDVAISIVNAHRAQKKVNPVQED
jgi:hypothetical protein